MLRNAFSRNRFVWYALALYPVLIALAVAVPMLATVLRIEAIGVKGWALAVACSLLPLAAGQVWLTFSRSNACQAMGPQDGGCALFGNELRCTTARSGST